MEFDTTFIANIMNTIAPVAIEMGITFAIAENIFQWFIRIAFGRQRKEL